MLLSDRDIRRQHGDTWELDPFDPAAVQPASVDLRLGHGLITYDDFGGESDLVLEWDRPYVLNPLDFALAHTQEVLSLSGRMAAKVEGKSSLGRVGLAVHVTAGFIDPGFSGQITLELVNLGSRPIELRRGMKIAQLCLFPTSTMVDQPYGHPSLGSRYQGQTGPTEARPERLP